jgi:hypothetical protein
MGNTFKTGNYVNGIFQDTSNNIGIGAAPSGTYKFEVTGTAKVSGILTLGSTLSNGTYTYTLPAATGTLALVGGAGVGTVTSVAALTLGTTGTDLSSTVANSTTTPVITLNVPTASATNRGALSSADFTTFNSKQGTITLTTTGTSGAATFSSNTLNIPNYGSALSGYLPLTGGTLTGALYGTSASFTGNVVSTLGFLQFANNYGIEGRNAANTAYRTVLKLNSSNQIEIGRDTDISAIILGTASATNALTIASTGAATFSSGIATLGYTASTSYAALFNGSVGIGTTAPVTKLSLGGYNGARLPYINGTSNTFDANGITIPSSNTSNAGIGGGIDLTNNTYSVGAYSPIISFSSLGSNSAYNNSYAGIWGVYQGQGGDANWGRGDLAFGTAIDYGIVERMRIKDTGNVLIGTTTDTGYRLSVTTSSTIGIKITTSGSTYANPSIAMINGAIDTTISATTNGLEISTYSNHDMLFRTNQVERMRITSGGQVGIGTSSVDSTISVDIQNLSPTSNNVFLRIKNNSGSEDCGLKIAGIFGTAYEHTIGVNTIISSGDLCFHNSNTLGYRWFIDGSTKLMVASNGNVLIGTTTDDTVNKLQVSGKGYFSNLLSVGLNSSNDGLSTNTKLRISGDGSPNAGASMGSCFAAAGSGSGYDTGISVNMGTSGATMLLMASINTSTGTSTNSAVYIVRFYFSGNNLPSTTYLGGSSDFVTFSVSGSNTLILTASNSGNRSYSWFFNKIESN